MPGRFPEDAFEPVGCVSCKSSGFRGRIGVYEVMAVTDELRPLILERASGAAIGEAAMAGGMRRMRDDGLEKVRQGLTSVPELLRVLGS